MRVTALATRDLSAVWRQVDTRQPLAVKRVMLDALPVIGETYGDIAATVAADLYDTLREEAAPRRAFSADPAPLNAKARLEATARWGIEPLFGAAPTPATALTLLGGGLQRFIADAHRDTITEAIAADPVKVGWVRAGIGECDWCQQYLDGEVHYVEGYDFDAHDNCHCIAVPSWG